MNCWLSRCEVPIIRHTSPPPTNHSTLLPLSDLRFTPLIPPLLYPSRSNSTITRNGRSINRRSNSFLYSDCVPDSGLFKTGHLKLKLPFAITIKWTHVTNVEQLQLPICSGVNNADYLYRAHRICIYSWCASSDPVAAVTINISGLWNVTPCSARHIHWHFGAIHCFHHPG